MPRRARPWFRRFDRWWYITINGKAEKLAPGRKNKQAAYDRWHELMIEQAANPPIDGAAPTVASVIDLHLVHSQRVDAPRSYENRKHYLQLFAEAHGLKLIDECRPIHLTSWIDSHSEWVSDWTRSNVVRVVQRAFNWAGQQGVIRSNPFRGVAQRPGEPRRPITDKEFRALLRATGSKHPNGRKRIKRRRLTPAKRFRQVLFFLRYTGARPGEMAGLTWESVHLDRAVIVLNKHKTVRTQRTPRPRVILLVPLVVKLLRRIKAQEKTGAKYVFITHRGTPWNRYSLGLRMRRLRKRAGLTKEVKLYGIRHQFGTQAIVGGVDIKTLAELMGHTTTRTTEHYIHLAGRQEHLAAAMLRATASHPDT